MFNNKTYDDSTTPLSAEELPNITSGLYQSIEAVEVDILSSDYLQNGQRFKFGLIEAPTPNITYTTNKMCSYDDYLVFIFYIAYFLVFIIITYLLKSGYVSKYRKPLPPPTPVMSSTPVVERKILQANGYEPTEQILLFPTHNEQRPYKPVVI